MSADENMRLPKRFIDKVEVDSAGCWLWTGALRHNGYGHLWTPSGDKAAHRFAYEHCVGPIPDGMELDHLCRVRHCVNPSHLEVVTKGENIRRGARGYGARTHCRSGRHDITDPVNVIDRGNGHRQCRPCAQESWARSGAKRRVGRSRLVEQGWTKPEPTP